MRKIVGGVGVDGGGFVITPNGVIPVPPWEPSVRARLDAVAALARLSEHDSKAEVAPVVRQLLSEVSARLGVEGSAHYVYYAADGYGFVSPGDGDGLCPVPLEERLRKLLESLRWRVPWPVPEPDPQPNWLLNKVTERLVQRVEERGGDVLEFLDAPERVAAALGLTLPEFAARHVKQLAPR